jgi:hypothetical protein
MASLAWLRLACFFSRAPMDSRRLLSSAAMGGAAARQGFLHLVQVVDDVAEIEHGAVC